MLNTSSFMASIYRHFKGGYYIVQSVAHIESTGEEVVVYQSLQDGNTWVRPVSVFREPVPEGTENPTGQKYRFEQVTKFDNQLSMVSTENLVQELLKRSDCPIGLSMSDSHKVWREKYLVGLYEKHFITSDYTSEDFNTLAVFDNAKSAELHLHSHPNLSVLKVVYLKQDFD